MVFFIRTPRSFRWGDVKPIVSLDNMKTVTRGDVVDMFGHICEWDDDCVPHELCERYDKAF